jgi:hypothetical protein
MHRNIGWLAVALTPWLLAGGAPATPEDAYVLQRRALGDPDPARRLAAVYACEIVWDHAALPLLREREGDADPGVRRASRRLVRRFHIWGPERPTWGDRERANRPGFAPHDRAGLRAWRRRGAVQAARDVDRPPAEPTRLVSPPATAPAAAWP